MKTATLCSRVPNYFFSHPLLLLKEPVFAGTQPEPLCTTSSLCVAKVLGVALANAAAAAAHRGRARAEPERLEPTPQQKPRQAKRKDVFTDFTVKPTDSAKLVVKTIRVPAVRDEVELNRSEKSQSPSPERSRPPGYSEKRRKVATAIAAALRGLAKAEEQCKAIAPAA
ncbi:unnamed protein product [Durusdinium trenchii]|uniref:Uncharacterized protein n=1 Tax=Durusdinium trenchii TaxID=1381693 RepID=A0ABP0LDR5_9DINO